MGGEGELRKMIGDELTKRNLTENVFTRTPKRCA